MNSWMLLVCFPWMIMPCEDYNAQYFKTRDECVVERDKIRPIYHYNNEANINCYIKPQTEWEKHNG